MGIFKLISEVMTAVENPPRPAINRRPAPPVPVDRLKLLIAQGKHSEAVQMLVRNMNWSLARAEYFVNDLEKQVMKGTIQSPRNTGRNDTSTKIDRILREQEEAEAMAGGSFFDYIKARFRLF